MFEEVIRKSKKRLHPFKEIENVIYNRPISYTYFESDLIEPITPNKLLYGQNLEVINTVNETSPMVVNNT